MTVARTHNIRFAKILRKAKLRKPLSVCVLNNNREIADA